jgi:uncharacterized protein YkwD
MRLALSLAVLALVAPAAAAAQSPGTPASTEAVTMTSVADLEGQVLVALNAVRKEHGLVPLRLNGGLASAARGHSRQMAQLGYFQHASYDGSAFWTRIKPLYKPLARRSWGAGENMVWSSPALSAEQAIQMWMASPPHRKNILTPGWRDIGIGGVHALAAPGVYNGLDVTILTADFGVR